MAGGGACPVQVLYRDGADAGGRWSNLGAAYAAVTFLRPQGQSLVLYAGPQRRIVLAYPILPGDAFERLDGATLCWAVPESGDEVALCFADEAACAAVCGAISAFSPSMLTPAAAVADVAERLAGLRVARDEGSPAPAPAPAPAGEDIAARLSRLSIGRP